MPLRTEEAAFAFMRALDAPNEGGMLLESVEVLTLSGPELSFQSAYHIEVSEEAQARVIKRAHDLGASLVEFHSHVADPGPQFSQSDWAGFEEFVPHVWFRLKGMPYAAIVMSNHGLDALAWVRDAGTPVKVDQVQFAQDFLIPSGLSIGRLTR